MKRIVVAVAVAALVAPAEGHAARWDFKTKDDSAYCRFEGRASFRCVRPRDGFWMRFQGVFAPASTRVAKGTSSRFRGVHGGAAIVLKVGRSFISSDAEVITCWNRRRGLTCKQYSGLSFWIGRRRGWRIFFDAPGRHPEVVPLFRTRQGVWCGIAADVLEPSNPLLECWRPSDGLLLTLLHDDYGRGPGYEQRGKAHGYRPGGFRLLRAGETFVWRCRDVGRMWANRCGATTGKHVFTCGAGPAGVTCRNRAGRGFWVSRRNFSPL